MDDLTQGFESSFNKEACYKKLAQMGYEYGHYFQGLENVWMSEDVIVSKIKIEEDLYDKQEVCFFHPSLIDACFQTFITSEFLMDKEQGEIRLPVSVGKVRLLKNNEKEIWVVADIKENCKKNLRGSIKIYNNQGQAIGEIRDFQAMALDQVASNVPDNRVDAMLYDITWEELEPMGDNDEIAVGNNDLVVLFEDDNKLSEEVAKIYKDKGYACLMIRHGDKLSIDEKKQILFTYLEMIKKALMEVFDLYFNVKKYKCKDILHLDNTGYVDNKDCTMEDLENTKQKTYSLVVLADTILESGIKSKLTIITRGSQRVGLEENINPLVAPAWGLGRVLYQQELTENFGYLIDLSLESKSIQDDAQMIYNSLSTNSRVEKELVIRQNATYIPKLGITERIRKSAPLNFKKGWASHNNRSFWSSRSISSKKKWLHMGQLSLFWLGEVRCQKEMNGVI